MSDKIRAKDLPRKLTDDLKVIRAMKAIQRAGLWTLVMGIALPCNLVFLVLNGASPTILLISLLTIYLVYAGIKMNRLSGGASIVVILIINVLVISRTVSFFPSLLMIIPLVFTVISIIALFKVRRYLKWRKTTPTIHKTLSPSIKKLTCDVRIFDPAKGELIEERTIDSDIFKNFASRDGRVYAMRERVEGKSKTRLVKESTYRTAVEAFGVKV